MAAAIVLVELAAFQVIYLVTKNYYLATIISFTLAVLLNWTGGRILVFGVSRHHAAKEFSMVLVASIVGVVIQLSVVYISINTLLLYPLIGKVISIGFSFFWNYWFRAKIIYRTQRVTGDR